VNIEPIGSIDSNSTPLIELLQVLQTSQSHRHATARQPSDLAYLTAGDRDFLTAVYGPGVLVAAGTAVERFGTPQFLLDVIADRKDGQLPIGTELTSTYVQARYQAHVDLNGMVTNPLTERNLLDAQAYFDHRIQGAAIDLQA